MIRIIDGYKEYKKKKVIFNNLNLELPSKGLVVVSGESGCGKSTLLNIISGLDTLTSGKLEHNYNNNDYACILLQQDYIFKNITIYDYLCFICNSYQKNKSIINDLLNKFKINDIKDKFGCDLSIGQIRRVELIRCIIMDLPVFICDEPTSSLDDDNKKIVVDILYELSKDHLVLVSTHDVELFNHSDTMKIVFDNGIICNVLPEHKELSKIEDVKVKGYFKYIYINNKFNYFIISLVFLLIQTVSLVLFCSSILKNKQIDIPELSSYIDNLFIIILFVFVICFSVCLYLTIMLYRRYLLDNKKMCGLLLVLREKKGIMVWNLVLPLVIVYCITLVTSVIIGLLFISCINSYSKETYGFTLMIVNTLLVMYLIIVNLILGIIILGIGFSILNRNRIYYIRNEE